MRLFAIVSYHGKNYAGWQRQPNALSIQEVIETELSKYFNREITIIKLQQAISTSFRVWIVSSCLHRIR